MTRTSSPTPCSGWRVRNPSGPGSLGAPASEAECLSAIHLRSEYRTLTTSVTMVHQLTAALGRTGIANIASFAAAVTVTMG